MNLYGLGLSALLTAQQNLQTTGHNINNAAVEGYHRQTVLTKTQGANATGAGYIGRGVHAVTVQRAYDHFLNQQLIKSKSKNAQYVAYGNEIEQLNNLFSDRSSGISPAIQNFFAALQAVASTPDDAAGRQELIGRAQNLVTQLRETDQFILNQRTNLNTQITTQTHQINSYVQRIHDLNVQITKARAATPEHEPNDLLDQRNQLLSELNELVEVRAFEQEGRLNLTLSGGQLLLSGSTVHELRAIPSADDPARHVIAHQVRDDQGSHWVEIPDRQVQGGALGGLLSCRSQTLDAAQYALGRLALGLGHSINELHAQGVDLHGQRGEEFFGFSVGQALPIGKGAANTQAPVLEVELLDVTQLTLRDYQISAEVDEAGELIDLSFYDAATGRSVRAELSADGQSYELEGLRIHLPAGSVDGQTQWSLQPTRQAAASMTLQLDDPSRFAAAAEGSGAANGEQALRLAGLQSKNILAQGSMSFNDAYGQMVNRVAVQTQENTAAAQAQENLVQQNYAAQQRVAGVNLNEEYLMLEQYVEQFRAASKMIEVGTVLFDTLLGIRS